MTHNSSAVLDPAPLVKIASYDLLGTIEQAAAFAADELRLMSTKTGLSTVAVDRNHDFVAHLGLAERVRLPEATDLLATGGRGTTNASARAVLLGAAAGGVVILVAAGTWYFVHKLSKTKAGPEAIQPGVEAVLAEAEPVVDAELAHLSRTGDAGIIELGNHEHM